MRRRNMLAGFGESTHGMVLAAKSGMRWNITIPGLITHGPPYGILDAAPGSENHAGCHELLKVVQEDKAVL
jgi:Icc-related predicted phosphoesterase